MSDADFDAYLGALISLEARVDHPAGIDCLAPERGEEGGEG